MPRCAAAVAKKKRALCVRVRRPPLLHVHNKKMAIKATAATDWSQTTTTAILLMTTTNNNTNNNNTAQQQRTAKRTQEQEERLRKIA